MYAFGSMVDRNEVEAEMGWTERDEPKTLYGMIERTAAKYPNRPAASFQWTSGPTDAKETVTWREMLEHSIQAANLFRSLGVEEGGVVAYLLPNSLEAMYTMMGGWRDRWDCEHDQPPFGCRTSGGNPARYKRKGVGNTQGFSKGRNISKSLTSCQELRLARSLNRT